jgi:hypothetical protein
MTCDRLEQGDLLGNLGETMDPHVQECGDCRARAGHYARLAATLAQESDRPLPDDWKRRALERLRRERAARRRRTALTGSLAAAVTVAVILLATRRDGDRPPPGQLVVSIVKGGGTWRGHGRAHPGDLMHISFAPGPSSHFALRVYRDASNLLVSCAEEPTATCRHRDGAIEVTWRLADPGEYDVILLVSPSPLPPLAGELDADVRAARKAGARVVAPDGPVDVD